MKKPIKTLDEFAKVFFKGEELFNGLCKFVGAMMKLTDARSEITDRAIKRIYGKGENS